MFKKTEQEMSEKIETTKSYSKYLESSESQLANTNVWNADKLVLCGTFHWKTEE